MAKKSTLTWFGGFLWISLAAGIGGIGGLLSRILPVYFVPPWVHYSNVVFASLPPAICVVVAAILVVARRPRDLGKPALIAGAITLFLGMPVYLSIANVDIGQHIKECAPIEGSAGDTYECKLDDHADGYSWSCAGQTIAKLPIMILELISKPRRMAAWPGTG